MSLPKNISRSHLLNAIKKIDNEGVALNADSTYYDVAYNGKRYPPKLIVSYANLFANGEILDRSSFEGGKGTACFRLLEKNGFTIVGKTSVIDATGKSIEYNRFSNILLKFLQQANESSLKTKDYNGMFKKLRIRVSFGRGNTARIPWLALLKEGQEVQKGIYPVYLYYKQQKLLILAYGVSETEMPDSNWNVLAPAVETFLQTEFDIKPERYGTSLVFKYYRIDNTKESFGLDLDIVEEDINQLTDVYNKMNLNQRERIMERPITEQMQLFSCEEFIGDARSINLSFSDSLILRFISSLCTKPFVILTGLSGSGKTKLAQTFSKWVCEREEQICIVPVGADWTNREPLLGYVNALSKDEYILPENGALNLILTAKEDPDRPYFLILDEMNLSHVERYFADFLSAMESEDFICLHANSDMIAAASKNKIPSRIKLPKNLFVIGTVNIDETTYMFSPKVLDRANVIEFRISEEEMSEYLASNNGRVKMDQIYAKGASMAKSFVQLASSGKEISIDRDELKNILTSFFIELKKVGAEFGFRSAAEILRFVEVVRELGISWNTDQIIDSVVMQKLLPRLHGSRRKLESTLKALGALCLVGEKKIDILLNVNAQLKTDEKTTIRYPLSLDKIKRMYHGLMTNAFTSYAEA